MNKAKFMHKLGTLIHRTRLQQNLTQEVLAEKANMSIAILNYMENGKRETKFRNCIKVFMALGLSMDEFASNLPLF